MAATNLNLVKKSQLLQTFDHEGPAVVNAMCDIMVGISVAWESLPVLMYNSEWDIFSASWNYQR